MKPFEMKAWIWAKSCFRDMYPFLVCMLGGTFMAADIGWVGDGIAALCFVWALDLAGTRAAASAREDTAAKLTAMLVSGGDTTVTVDINHNA